MSKNKTISISFVWVVISVSLIFEKFEHLNAEDVQVQQYLGCFYDNVSLSHDGFCNTSEITNLTVEMCIQHCRNTFSSKGSWTYARLQNGTDCRCENEQGIQTQDSACNLTCEGNSSQYCGGALYNQVPVYVLYAVCPIGTYGPGCDEVCHCQRQIPCNRQTGKCPNGCSGNYTGEQCDQIASFSEQYIGCYKDYNLNRSMEKSHRSDNRNSLRFCLDICSLGNSYAGPQFGRECWCGESYDKHGPLNETDCNMPCSGNARQICGGAVAISVYHSCPVGNYGPRCAKVCNCKGRCHFQNGTCQENGCKPGWTGDTCNMRDCSVNNGDCYSHEICITAKPIISLNLSVCRCETGYWRNQLWESCSDIDECSEPSSVCGPLAKSCNNTEGGYTCYCKNGAKVTNSACRLDAFTYEHTPKQNLTEIIFLIGAAVVAFVLPITVVVVAIICIRRFKENKETAGNKENSEGNLEYEPIENQPETETITLTEMSPESEEAIYSCLINRNADDNRIYETLNTRDHANNIRVDPKQ